MFLLLHLLVALFNVFFWDRDPKRAARCHGDKHLQKMIVECAQIVSTAYRLRENLTGDHDFVYRPVQPNGNIVQWAAASSAHFTYVLELGLALVEERERVRVEHDKKTWKQGHQSAPTLLWLKEHMPNFDRSDWADPPLRMPDCCKVDGQGNALSAVEAYRLLAAYKERTIGIKYYGDEPDFLAEKRVEVDARQDILDAIEEELERKKKSKKRVDRTPPIGKRTASTNKRPKKKTKK